MQDFGIQPCLSLTRSRVEEAFESFPSVRFPFPRLIPVLWKQAVSVSQRARHFQGGKERKRDSSCSSPVCALEGRGTCWQEGACGFFTYCTAEMFPLSVPAIFLCRKHYQLLNISPKMANIKTVYMI